ncbi:MAG: hypothetical protein VXY70_02915, partial [Actinomycetota bacterium]|nr:hypothetical protein [Actinomycetota bacterium]
DVSKFEMMVTIAMMMMMMMMMVMMMVTMMMPMTMTIMVMMVMMMMETTMMMMTTMMMVMMMMIMMMISTMMLMMMMVTTMTLMMTMCFQLPLQRLADSRGSALGAFVRTHYTGCCGLRSTAGERWPPSPPPSRSEASGKRAASSTACIGTLTSTTLPALSQLVGCTGSDKGATAAACVRNMLVGIPSTSCSQFMSCWARIQPS